MQTKSMAETLRKDKSILYVKGHKIDSLRYMIKQLAVARASVFPVKNDGPDRADTK